MSKIIVEWQESTQAWRRITVKVLFSQLGNCYFKHNEKIYAFHALKEGAEVVTKENGKWVKAGRISHGDVFLGDGQSYAEWSQTSEGQQDIKTLLASLRAR